MLGRHHPVEKRLDILPFVPALLGLEGGAGGVPAGDPLRASNDRRGDEDG
jgi:hypothetical protein